MSRHKTPLTTTFKRVGNNTFFRLARGRVVYCKLNSFQYYNKSTGYTYNVKGNPAVVSFGFNHPSNHNTDDNASC